VEDQATTAALVGVAMGLIELLKKGFQKTQGSSVEFRLAALEKQIEVMGEKMSEFHRMFYEFREQTLIKWAKEERDEGRD
jgi:hypothetical protein